MLHAHNRCIHYPNCFEIVEIASLHGAAMKATISHVRTTV